MKQLDIASLCYQPLLSKARRWFAHWCCFTMEACRKNPEKDAANGIHRSIKDLEEGFSVGADDYVTKPFDLNVLIIRINAKIKKRDQITISKEAVLDTQNGTLKIGKDATSNHFCLLWRQVA